MTQHREILQLAGCLLEARRAEPGPQRDALAALAARALSGIPATTLPELVADVLIRRRYLLRFVTILLSPANGPWSPQWALAARRRIAEGATEDEFLHAARLARRWIAQGATALLALAWMGRGRPVSPEIRPLLEDLVP